MWYFILYLAIYVYPFFSAVYLFAPLLLMSWMLHVSPHLALYGCLFLSASFLFSLLALMSSMLYVSLYLAIYFILVVNYFLLCYSSCTHVFDAVLLSLLSYLFVPCFQVMSIFYLFL